ncbi:2-dehydro-3-deoxygalactonokinase [Spirochaetia bacterium]|nr:2-dehydro-3-deoxygalactonokinase [Spirochaetia bacterium]
MLIIDGGTTKTSFTLLEHGKVCTQRTCKVGASASFESGKNESLKEAVKSEIAALEAEYNCVITDIYAAGMITSNVGLKEIPHITAPVSFETLAALVVNCRLDEISRNGLFHFIPGIKFIHKYGSPLDVLRGEEVEIFGALDRIDKNQAINFIHFGSHNKIIRYENAAITNAITTISGELLSAISSNTILKNSIADIDNGFVMNMDYVRNGYMAAKKNGVSGSLFKVRIGHIMENYSGDMALSFVFGILLYDDIFAFMPLLQQNCDLLVLYGRDSFINAFRAVLDCFEEGTALKEKLITIPFDESKNLSLRGILRIHENGGRP